VNGTVSDKASTHFLDGSPIVWYNWQSAEPIDSFSCAVIFVGVPDLKWFKQDCSGTTTTVLCERKIAMSVSSYMEQLVKAVDELEATVIKDRANMTLLLKENEALKDGLDKEVAPALRQVIDRIRALTKASR